MQTVLFKTSDPVAEGGMVEFYIVSFTLGDFDARISVVQETHGWWNGNTREATIEREAAPVSETFKSFSHAIERFCALRINRAKDGFVHSFSWNGFRGIPSNYKRIDPSASRTAGRVTPMSDFSGLTGFAKSRCA